MLFAKELKMFMDNKMIELELAYASTQREYLKSLCVPHACTVRQLIEQSDIIAQFPEIDLTINKVGIFAKQVALDTPLYGGERVEIYRSLRVDPKQRRRLLAQQADNEVVVS